MIVKNAFSRILHSFVILLISSSVMSLLFILSYFLLGANLVAYSYGYGFQILIKR
jgi:uncharacterized MnhB-related membrane protein